MSRQVGAVVLAGGRSSRFGADKLTAELAGRPLLDHVLAAVAAVDPDIEVVVAAAPGVDRPLPDGARLVADPHPFGGPLAGLSSGLAALDPAVDVVIAVGGDMPWLVPAVLRRMLDILATDRATDIVALDDDGQPRPLPLALRRAPASAAATDLLATGDHRLRGLFPRLRTTTLPGAAWRALDPDGATIRDVDTPADLAEHPRP